MNTKYRSEIDFEERNGRTLSRRKEFFPNGNLFREGLYSKGYSKWEWDIPIGMVKTYNESGHLRSEEFYDDSGTLEGESKYYSKSGELEKIVTYSNGKMSSEKLMNTKEMVK